MFYVISENQFVLVITCLGGRFGINYMSAFLKIFKLPEQNDYIFKFSKIKRVIYLKIRPNQTCDYWLITPNQQPLCIVNNIS